MSGTRTYRMSARAAAADATRERIVDAAADAFTTSWYDDVTMRAIASDAGVALQTVVNHFGSKDALFVAAAERMAGRIHRARWTATPGDLDGALRILVEDYELNGDAIMRLLAVEPRVPVLTPVVNLGRLGHEKWVGHVFGAALAGLHGHPRARRLNLLVVATDVYTWKLLRRDKGFSPEQTIAAMRELVVALHPDERENPSRSGSP